MGPLFTLIDTPITEIDVYEYVQSIFVDLNIDKKYLKPGQTENESVHGLWVGKALILNTVILKKYDNYIEIKAAQQKHLTGVDFTPIKAGKFLKVVLSNRQVLEAIRPAITASILDGLREKDFDCCGSYMECSEAGKCIIDKNDFPLRCSYADKLRQGINFYK